MNLVLSFDLRLLSTLKVLENVNEAAVLTAHTVNNPVHL